MTFQDLIDLHRQALRNPEPVPVRIDRRNRLHRAPSWQIFTDWASI